MTADGAAINIPIRGRRARSLEAEITRGLKAENDRLLLEAALRKEERKALAEAKKLRLSLTREQVEGAKVVNDGDRWYRVVRVNAKSVTVLNPLGVGTMLLPFSRIVGEAR